jgi:hypothetical protein
LTTHADFVKRSNCAEKKRNACLQR